MIPVVWLSWHPEVPGRGYWDQAMLEDLFAGAVWRPAGFPQFDHIEVHGEPLPDLDGAIVVLPGRFHTDAADRLTAELAHYRWVHLIVTSDEESLFPWYDVAHPNMTMWVMTPHPAAHRKAPQLVSRYLGEGYQPGTPELAGMLRPAGTDRPLLWSFLGQITHRRRQELARALRQRLRRNPLEGRLIETRSFAAGAVQADYVAWLCSAKVAPAPSGPVTLDSFRLYEALEAGCIPVVEMTNGKGERYGPDFWPLLFGDRHDLFAAVENWESDLDPLLEQLEAGWPMNQVRSTAAWIAYKRDLACQLAAELWRTGPEPYEVDDHITVIIPTSPIARHPATDIIDETIASIRARLPRAEIIVACDGVRPEQEEYRPAYEEYLRSLTWKCLHTWDNVLPLIASEHVHQANLTRMALEEVRSPCVLFVEHDTPLVGDIPFSNLVEAVETGQAFVVRLHHEASVLEPHQHLMLDEQTRDLAGVPALRTVQWSQRPHLAATSFYREMIHDYFGQASRTMIEDVMHGVVDHHWRLQHERGWERFRLWLYAPPGDMKRSEHLDGRRRPDGELDSKFEEQWVFAYDGHTPEGAPNPNRDEAPA